MEQIIVLTHRLKESAEQEPTAERQERLAEMALELVCLIGSAEGAA